MRHLPALGGVALWVVATFQVATLTASAKADAVDRFVREYPAAAKRIEAVYSRIRAEAELIQRAGKSPSSEASHVQLTLASDHGLRKAQLVQHGRAEARIGGGTRETVYRVGEDVCFMLRRASTDQPYEATIDTRNTESAVMEFNSLVGKYVGAPYAVNGFPLTTMMALDGFEVLSAERNTENGRSFLHVSCQYGQAPKTELDIVFDLDAGWVIRRSEWRPRGNAHNAIITEIAYDHHNSHDGVPFPRVVELKEPPDRLNRCVFAHFARQSTPRNEFLLSHYGLAALETPVSETPAFRISPAVVCLILGVLGLCVTVAIRRLAAR